MLCGRAAILRLVQLRKQESGSLLKFSGSEMEFNAEQPQKQPIPISETELGRDMLSREKQA